MSRPSMEPSAEDSGNVLEADEIMEEPDEQEDGYCASLTLSDLIKPVVNNAQRPRRRHRLLHGSAGSVLCLDTNTFAR